MEQFNELNNYIVNFHELYNGYIHKDIEKSKVTDIFKGWFAMNNPERIMPDDEVFLDEVKSFVANIDEQLKKIRDISIQNKYATTALKVMLMNREEKITVAMEMYINAAQVFGIPLVKYLDADAKALLQEMMITKTKKNLLLPNQKKLFKALYS